MLLDGFLKFDSLPGGSTDGLHEKEIEILSFRQRIVRIGKLTTDDKPPWPQYSAVTVVKLIDEVSPKLTEAVCLYNRAFEATLTLRGSKLKAEKITYADYFKVVLKKAFITRIHYVGNLRLHLLGEDDPRPVMSPEILDMGPIEEIDISFEQIEWEYEQPSNSFKWNVVNHKAPAG